jgi:very-short-patch-repair endonuclease
MNKIRSRARALRNNPTDVEKLLWRQLRMWQLDGYKFRRQQPLGNFIVDFVCLDKRLIVELDGGQHAERSDDDANRDAWLSKQGFTVLRFWNNDVLKNVTTVTERIFETLKNFPFLSPSPQGGRKKIQGRNNPVKINRKA